MVKRISDAVPFNNEKCQVLGMIADRPYDRDAVSGILRDTPFHKLSWKEVCPEAVPKTGGLTVYGFLKKM
jgi:hypothetical protein